MPILCAKQCQQARLSRDRRFDGRFYIAVKTTGIFCRPICPAMLPKESNVEYFADATQAADAGYRPCLRCRPDSAPGSWAWRGTETTLHRAIHLIDEGALQQQSLNVLAARLGVSDRYLRMLFQDNLGLSPKRYALMRQLMFAKQLLHSSPLTVTDIALASGFNSVRRFNDAFQKQFRLTPTDIRKAGRTQRQNRVLLAYRPPLNWSHLLEFYRLRMVDGMERIIGQRYERTIEINGTQGWFAVEPEDDHQLSLSFELSDLSTLRPLVQLVRRLLDLDADIDTIQSHLQKTPLGEHLTDGLRIPGVASTWEAGVRAILGQQISVKAAINQVNRVVQTLGADDGLHPDLPYRFPTPVQIAQADLSFLRMPASRRDTLKRFAEFVRDDPDASVNDWLQIKGIGPWTVQYAKLRGLSEPDEFLSGDLVVRKQLEQLPTFDTNDLSPWGSYATFQFWNLAS